MDQNDPDMGVSNVLEVLHHQETAGSVGAPSSHGASDFRFTKDDLVAVVGEDQGFVYTLTVDLSHLRNQPLSYWSSRACGKGRAFEDVVHVVPCPQLLEGKGMRWSCLIAAKPAQSFLPP